VVELRADEQSVNATYVGRAMDREELEHLEEMKRICQKRLRVLELKVAWQGVNTPADILLEIDSLREQIAHLQAQINTIPPGIIRDTASHPYKSNVSHISPRKQVKIVFDGDFENITPEIQGATIRAVAAMIDIPPEQVIILKVMSGSVVFVLDLPEEAANKLIKLYITKDRTIKELNIRQVSSVVTEKVDDRFAYEKFRQAIEEKYQPAWTYIEKTYDDMVEQWIIEFCWEMNILPDNIDSVLPSVFRRFKGAMKPDTFKKFPSIGSILAYLKAITRTIVIDDIRNGLISGTSNIPDPIEQERLSNLWLRVNEVIKDEQEREVAYSSFVLALKPKDIFEKHPDLFKTVYEVYNIKRRVIERLKRSPDFKNLHDEINAVSKFHQPSPVIPPNAHDAVRLSPDE
jgi:hypothetical protein